MPNQIPILICIDIEPDKRIIESADSWMGFESSWGVLQKLRTAISVATGQPAHFNWFVRIDPQIEFTHGSPDWALRKYRKLFARMQEFGDEIGLHPHSWRWNESDQKWFADFADQEWIEYLIRQSFSLYQQFFKTPCQNFRFGDRWLNNQTVDLLEQLGATFDFTIEPGKKSREIPEAFTGKLPDYTDALRHPYLPQLLISCLKVT